MSKYIVRYLILWLPAALVAYFFNNASMASQVAQWFCAFFMVFGWSVNTGMCAYHYPRTTLSLILVYTGINVLLIVLLYASTYASPLNKALILVGGALSYTPLDAFVRAILDFNIPHEVYVIAFLVACCFVGYCVGLAYRRVRPNPYSPRMSK